MTETTPLEELDKELRSATLVPTNLRPEDPSALQPAEEDDYSAAGC